MIKKGEKLRAAGKKNKLSEKEIEAKRFKKEFTVLANYFKFLKKVGVTATKDFKKAKKLLKTGDKVAVKHIIAKYTLMSVEEWKKEVE